MSSNGYATSRGLSYRDIENKASYVRRVLELSATDRMPGLRLFERLDEFHVLVKGQKIALDFLVDGLPLGVEAETRFRDGKLWIVLSQGTYLDLESRDWPRARFSMCHELGHAICHPELAVRLSGIPHHEAALMRGRSDHPDYRDSEWQANAFAAALLMPAQGLARLEVENGLLLPRLIAETYGVSWQSAEIRLNVFTRHRARLLRGGAAAGN